MPRERERSPRRVAGWAAAFPAQSFPTDAPRTNADLAKCGAKQTGKDGWAAYHRDLLCTDAESESQSRRDVTPGGTRSFERRLALEPAIGPGCRGPGGPTGGNSLNKASTVSKPF